MRLIAGSVVALSAVLMTTACGPVGLALGAGATVGTAAAREGGIGQTMSDKRIEAYINDAWFKKSTSMFNKLNLSVTEGRVLITGFVQDPQQRVDAVRLAWQAPGVKQVINEIKVEESKGITGYGSDSWILTQLRSRLIFDKDIESINYTTEAVGGVVYLMGVAQSQAELNKVVNHARSIRYVKEVVSYVRLRSDVNEQYSNEAGSSPAVQQTTTRTSSSSSFSSSPSPAPASTSYDYQPESRNVRAPVESSDLPPTR